MTSSTAPNYTNGYNDFTVITYPSSSSYIVLKTSGGTDYDYYTPSTGVSYHTMDPEKVRQEMGEKLRISRKLLKDATQTIDQLQEEIQSLKTELKNRRDQYVVLFFILRPSDMPEDQFRGRVVNAFRNYRSRSEILFTDGGVVVEMRIGYHQHSPKNLKQHLGEFILPQIGPGVTMDGFEEVR